MSAQASGDGRARAAIEGVTPVIDGGRFAVKRIVGDVLIVEADAFVDGHDVVLVRVEHLPPGATTPALIPMASPSGLICSHNCSPDGGAHLR